MSVRNHPPPEFPRQITSREKLARSLKRPAKENLKRLSNYTRVALRNIGYPIRRTWTTFASLGLLYHLFARLLALCVKPRTIYRALRIWPFSPIPYDQFKVWGRLEPPVSAYLESQPRSNHPDNIPWKPFGRMLPEERMGYVVEVENGVALSNGIALDSDGNTIMGASHRYKSFRQPPGQKGVSSRSSKSSFQNQLEQLGPLSIKPWSNRLDLKHLSGTVLILSNSHFSNYYHYIYDALSRLALVEDQMDMYHTIYIRNELPYQKRYLSMLELDDRQIIPADQAMPSGITADRLVIPCYTRAVDHTLDPKISSFLRKKLLPYADSALARGERVFISRNKDSHRYLLNEDELHPILTEHDFTILCLTDLSVDEQISVFKYAKIIVSPHGSGLANLLYCSPKTKVLEIFSGLNIDAFFLIAASLELEYFYLSGVGGNQRFVKFTDDITVDPNIFRQQIELLCR